MHTFSSLYGTASKGDMWAMFPSCYVPGKQSLRFDDSVKHSLRPLTWRLGNPAACNEWVG